MDIGKPKRIEEVPDRTTEPARRELPEPEKQPEREPAEPKREKVPAGVARARVLPGAHNGGWWT